MGKVKPPFERIGVFDLETSGLSKDKHAITEIAMVVLDFNTLEIVDRFEVLIRPYNKEYTEDAAKISGISVDMLEKDGIDVKEALSSFIEFINKQKVNSKKIVLSGHNIEKFDIPFLDVAIKEQTSKDLSKLINTEVYDTMKRVKWANLDTSKFSLGDCCAQYDIIIEQAHRAMPDTEANAKLVIRLLQSQRGHGQQTETLERKRVKFEL